jgi:hypothetical protein
MRKPRIPVKSVRIVDEENYDNTSLTSYILETIAALI